MSDREFQPLTGDPGLLEAKAKHYQAIGEAIQRASKELNKIHDVDGYKSQAVDKLKEMSKDTADDISKAKDRYAKTASALLAYASSLREAKDDADKAIALIGSKQADADAAKTAATNAHNDASRVRISSSRGSWSLTHTEWTSGVLVSDFHISATLKRVSSSLGGAAASRNAASPVINAAS